MLLSNEKKLTIRYKASARHSGNFGRIDPSFDVDGSNVLEVEADKV
jgi:hypothetical protein